MCFLPKSTAEMNKNPWSKDIDVIIGGCADEGLLLYYEPISAEQMIKLNENHAIFLLPELRSRMAVDNIQKAGTNLKELYYGKNDVTMDNRDKHIVVSIDYRKILRNYFNCILIQSVLW